VSENLGAEVDESGQLGASAPAPALAEASLAPLRQARRRRLCPTLEMEKLNDEFHWRTAILG
jgi:hypothetical protein